MRRHVLLTLTALFLAVAIAACGGGNDGDDESVDTPGVTQETAAPTNTASLGTSNAPVSRLIIPAIGLDRGTVPGLVDTRTQEMIAPRGAWDVAYYTYSAPPGKGNAVFSGHVDYIGIGPAVFWDLRKLEEGAEVIVRLADGLDLRYPVRFHRLYEADDGPWEELFARDAGKDVITLYTCDGDFDRASQDYSQRRVVRAERSG